MRPTTTGLSYSASTPSTVSTGWDIALDALELWVADLSSTQRLLTAVLGFQLVGVPTERKPDEEAVFLVNGGVRVILRQGMSEENPIARHVRQHGDTVADVALVCADPAAVANRAVAHGLRVWGTPDTPRIDLFDDGTVCHSVRRAPSFCGPPAGESPQMRMIDHVGYCLPWGSADTVASAYEKVFGLQRADADSLNEVGNKATGMRSIVLRSALGFTVVLTEPASPASTGQTQRFLDAHAGPGVQHAAFGWGHDDLFAAVESLRSSGLEFLPVPDAYYAQAQQRLPEAPVPWETLRRLGILVDADDQGLLFQLFTRPITSHGTFFIELIQRSGAVGFGANNVRALFEAVQATMEAHPGGVARDEDV
ncbi:VOC family protein [Streptomyces galilaeus]|uniref:VOC family protein n=1 Tax=Streptomyces galilaeus TaxID=33899 RepID=UPI0016797E61|nr:VOC family protein [Streptomyces galilaeus]GGW85951.1 4-hydroxyphenylpyruvate dioxygenase [Streptomyces galilaeus]